jgi:hypothetical protein
VSEKKRRSSGSQGFFGGEIKEDRSEKSLGNSDAAKDEVFPGRLDGGGGSGPPYEKDRRQGRSFERHPQKTQVVACQNDNHRQDENLVKREIEAGPFRCQSAMRSLDRHVPEREKGGRRRDSSGDDKKKGGEGVGEEILVEGDQGAMKRDLFTEDEGEEKGQEREGDIQERGDFPVAPEAKNDGSGDR